MELVYARERVSLRADQQQRNPRLFAEAEAGVSRVILHGDWPEIEAAYLVAGAKVSWHGKPDRPEKVSAPRLRTAEDPASVAIPDDWRSLPWSQPDERGLTLLGLASQIAPERIINKAQAIAAVEAEIERRGAE